MLLGADRELVLVDDALLMYCELRVACFVSPAQDPTLDLLLTVLDLVIAAVLNDRQNLPVQFV